MINKWVFIAVYIFWKLQHMLPIFPLEERERGKHFMYVQYSVAAQYEVKYVLKYVCSGHPLNYVMIISHGHIYVNITGTGRICWEGMGCVG